MLREHKFVRGLLLWLLSFIIAGRVLEYIQNYFDWGGLVKLIEIVTLVLIAAWMLEYENSYQESASGEER